MYNSSYSHIKPNCCRTPMLVASIMPPCLKEADKRNCEVEQEIEMEMKGMEMKAIVAVGFQADSGKRQ